jgi:F-type H+-transporting ATPase subunit delta
MANFTSIARPYALAAFDYARHHELLPYWKGFLNSAATVAQEETVAQWLNNPQVAQATLVKLFCEVLAPLLDEKRNNFLRLLAEEKRLSLLPAIAALFNDLYAALENTCSVQVVTAVEIDKELQEKFIAALTTRLKRKVTLHCKTDPSIIGGAIIHIGDRVIDGSIDGKLTRLLQNLSS